MLQPHTHTINTIKILTAISHLKESTQAWATFILEDYQGKLFKDYTQFT